MARRGSRSRFARPRRWATTEWRRSVGALRKRAGAADDDFQNQDVALTETAEQLVVSKQAGVVEEIKLRTAAGERVETISDTARHTEEEVEALASSPSRRPPWRG